MGVNGLWQVVSPCARPTNLATLNRKRLAVDASIWIYQFLKAVRDKEGNALRNSHVVGFFRRICKLLWFGILPVFVFDGGAPALKRATLQGRRRRREGRREDAVRTAGKLLAVQMHRLAEEDAERRRKGRDSIGAEDGAAPGEALPRQEDMVYAEEAHMSKTERLRSRRFHKQDAYHLPDLQNGIEAMGRPEDPRIMSIQELEEYARQFHNGEDINLYDFSKIDFNGEFFKSLPPADRYNILNAARLRSRLRMGLSKEQLDDMFPDRMAFSRFQIERVRERNHLTQRLMQEVGMTGLDLTLGVNARVAGEKDREYILVKNEGAEGGWALGVVSKEKDRGEIHKPIDVDALQFQYQARDEDEELEDDEDFEDVPVEGLNRLPKLRKQDADANAVGDNDDSLFVDADEPVENLFADDDTHRALQADEDEDLHRAIAMSLESQHNVAAPAGRGEEDEDLEDVPIPEWTQKAVQQAKPIATTSGQMVAHIVNNRANAAVPRRRDSNDSSDSDVDIRAALTAARKKKQAAPKPVPSAPVRPNVKNPFDGPLPFEKLNWRSSIFEKKPAEKNRPTRELREPALELEDDAGGFERVTGVLNKPAPESDEDVEAGGFEKTGQDDDAPLPLPPWMVDRSDIRDAVRQQQAIEDEINAQDRDLALEEERQRHKYNRQVIDIDSSDNEGSDIELLDAPPPQKGIAVLPEHSSPPLRISDTTSAAQETLADQSNRLNISDPDSPQTSQIPELQPSTVTKQISPVGDETDGENRSPSAEVEFEDVELPEQTVAVDDGVIVPDTLSPAMDLNEEVVPPPAQQERIEGIAAVGEDGIVIADEEFDDFSDPEEEELLAQMAEEAEEHARFASTLNNKSEQENQEAYERELKALRSQQKKDRRDADEVTQIMVTECQSLLRLFGIPYITAPMEAEAQCAELVSLNLVDGIVTDDSDIFLFGGTRVYKNMFNSNKFVECYLNTDLEKELSLSREQLISIAQLLGSDYTEGLPGVGPVTAIEILSEFPGPKGLDEFKDWWRDVQVNNRSKEADASSAFRKKFRKSQATKLFLPTGFPNPAVPEAYLKPEVDHSNESFQWGVPDLDGLRQFLMATIGWSQERTDEVLVPVIKDMNRREMEGTQSNITRYFTGGVGVGAKEVFAPRQKGKGSKRMAAAVDKLRAKTTGSGDGADAASEEQPAATGRKRKARTSIVVEDEEGDDADEENQDGRLAARPTRKSNGKKAKGPA